MDEQVEEKLEKNWAAIVSCSLGVVGILVMIALNNFPKLTELNGLAYVPLGTSFFGIIFGVFGRSTDDYQEGHSLALFGLILSIIPLCFYGFIYFLYLANPAG